MNLDELQTLWTSDANRPDPREQAQVLERFSATLHRRRRREAAWLIWTFFVLTTLTTFAGWLVFATDKIRLSAEWAAIPLLLVPWAFACLFLRRFFRARIPKHRGDATIADSLASAMAANHSERFKLKALGLMYVIVLPVLGFSIWQLHSVGKIAPREAVSMVAFLGGALVLSAGAVLARYWIGLVPEGRRLEALLAQCDERQ